MPGKVVARIKGGLGNQLFCYAAARRLALANNAELVIDNVTGFARDREYRRKYGLHHFRIPARLATPSERLEPLERYRRALLKWESRRKPFALRRYIEDGPPGFDPRLLDLKVNGTVYLDRLSQSESYFKDVEQTIRQDLEIIAPTDKPNLETAALIADRFGVAVHQRWFDTPGGQITHNLSIGYYRQSIALMNARVQAPHYFVFSDDPEAARECLGLSERDATFVSHNRGDEGAYADLWLMTLCRHFITANSTFSWWGAWLAKHREKIILTPDLRLEGKTAWGFEGLIPANWIKVSLTGVES